MAGFVTAFSATSPGAAASVTGVWISEGALGLFLSPEPVGVKPKFNSRPKVGSGGMGCFQTTIK